MKQPHDIQLKILQKLLFSKTLRYSEMKPDKEMENNQFQFHLNHLMNNNYVQKIDNKYSLTGIGKEYANRIDDVLPKIEKQAKISAWVAATRKRNEKTQYLIYTRLKHPFFGCQGFISGKIRFGESVIEAAKRELKEETNLSASKIDVVALVHFRVYEKDTQNLVEDKFMNLCLAENPKGKVMSNSEGKHKWVGEDELEEYLTNPFEEKDKIMKYVSYLKKYNGRPIFVEVEHFTDKF